MQRRFLDYCILTLKGMAMGAADLVPGVSGGTIAFISGIYEELISSINNFDFALAKTLKKNGFIAAWKQLNGNFLLALFIGFLVSILSLAQGIQWLLVHEPVLLWSFFFGLVGASIFFVAKNITRWNLAVIIALAIGAVVAYTISTLPTMGVNKAYWFLFLAGGLAICAMLLPGISGAFILLLLGAYAPALQALNNRDFKTLTVLTLGAIIGILSFSKILKWLFKHYRNLTLAVLTGFILGSLNKVWPWKKTISVMLSKTGEIIPFSSVSEIITLSVYQNKTNIFENYKTVLDTSISPFSYAELNAYDHQLPFAIILMITGFITIIVLERIGKNKY